MSKVSNNEFHKRFKSNSKADKIVIEEKNKWLIIDTKELVDYLKKNKNREIDINKVLKTLKWNIVIDKP